MKDQGAFSPLRALACEAVAAVPSTGGTVASLAAVGVGVVIATVLDVVWTESHDGEGWKDIKKDKIIRQNNLDLKSPC